MRGLALLALLLASGTAASAAAQSQVPLLEQARQARFAGRIDDAERLLNIALRSAPNDYMTLYNMGLVYEARAVRAAPGESRLQFYRTAAAWLERAFKAPGRSAAGQDAFTIYNSLGTMYLGLGDLSRANAYLQEGLRNEARLSDFSRGRLYGNVGYLYALQGDPKRAQVYFQKGAALGSAYSRENLQRFNTLQQLNSTRIQAGVR